MINKIKSWLILAMLSMIVIVPCVVIAEIIYTSNDESATIAAQNTFTDAFNPINGGLRPPRFSGLFNISISGDTSFGTVTMQRSFDGGSNWFDVQNWQTVVETSLTDNEPTSTYRIGFKTGDYTGVGTPTCRLSN